AWQLNGPGSKERSIPRPNEIDSIRGPAPARRKSQGERKVRRAFRCGGPPEIPQRRQPTTHHSQVSQVPSRRRRHQQQRGRDG
uniref:Uncharacterized protein n=1 Tax=Aegilops tauschii subsp. strangulata TaxID=200361 RepID=A0A453A2Z5_AEGTS